MRTRFYVLIAGLMGCIFGGCEKDIIVPQYNEFADGYLEMRMNTTWLYRVDSVYTETDRPTKNSKYYEKHIVIDSLLTSHDLTYNIQVYKSLDSTKYFELSRNYSLILNDSSVRLESTVVSFVILHTPLAHGNKWDNKHTQCYYKRSSIDNVSNHYEFNGTMYNNVLEVRHCDFFVYDRRNSHSSYYADRVGMISETRSQGFYNRLGRYGTNTTITKSLLNYAY
jgi:hypothetical protein